MRSKNNGMNAVILAAIMTLAGAGFAHAASSYGGGGSGQGGRGQGGEAGSHGARTTIAVYVPGGNELCRQGARKGGCGKPESSPKSTVCYYSQPNFGGLEACGKPGTLASSLSARWNDRISSVRIIGAARIKLCTGKGFDGRCEIVSSSRPDLADMSDRTSSLQILD